MYEVMILLPDILLCCILGLKCFVYNTRAGQIAKKRVGIDVRVFRDWLFERNKLLCVSVKTKIYLQKTANHEVVGARKCYFQHSIALKITICFAVSEGLRKTGREKESRRFGPAATSQRQKARVSVYFRIEKSK